MKHFRTSNNSKQFRFAFYLTEHIFIEFARHKISAVRVKFELILGR